MNDRKIILKEILTLLIGEAVCTALMFAVYALLGRWTLSVLLGGLAGCIITVGNFFFLSITATLASERAVQQDVEGAKKMLKASQTYRFIAVALLLVLCAASKACDLIALVLPLAFQRPVMLVTEFFRKKEA